jgi:hypothetical protein
VTDEELKAIDEKAGVYERDGMQFVHMPDVRALVAEVRRLRGLIKKAEWYSGAGGFESEHGCPWCDSDGYYESSHVGHGKHQEDCPAFTRNGDVK